MPVNFCDGAFSSPVYHVCCVTTPSIIVGGELYRHDSQREMYVCFCLRQCIWRSRLLFVSNCVDKEKRNVIKYSCTCTCITECIDLLWIVFMIVGWLSVIGWVTYICVCVCVCVCVHKSLGSLLCQLHREESMPYHCAISSRWNSLELLTYAHVQRALLSGIPGACFTTTVRYVWRDVTYMYMYIYCAVMRGAVLYDHQGRVSNCKNTCDILFY